MKQNRNVRVAHIHQNQVMSSLAEASGDRFTCRDLSKPEKFTNKVLHNQCRARAITQVVCGAGTPIAAKVKIRKARRATIEGSILYASSAIQKFPMVPPSAYLKAVRVYAEKVCSWQRPVGEATHLGMAKDPC